jgi:hypothetical protein
VTLKGVEKRISDLFDILVAVPQWKHYHEVVRCYSKGRVRSWEARQTSASPVYDTKGTLPETLTEKYKDLKINFYCVIIAATSFRREIINGLPSLSFGWSLPRF